MNKLPYGLAVLVTIVAVTVVQGRAGLAASAVVLARGQVRCSAELGGSCLLFKGFRCRGLSNLA